MFSNTAEPESLSKTHDNVSIYRLYISKAWQEKKPNQNTNSHYPSVSSTCPDTAEPFALPEDAKNTTSKLIYISF